MQFITFKMEIQRERWINFTLCFYIKQCLSIKKNTVCFTLWSINDKSTNQDIF